MRIGVQQAYFSRNRVGGELHTQLLGTELAARGHEVVVCTDGQRSVASYGSPTGSSSASSTRRSSSTR